MFKIFLPILLLIIVPYKVALADTWEEFQRIKAVEEESAPIPKGGPKLIPKDVIIEKLKTDGYVTYTGDALLFHFGQAALKDESMPNLKSMADALVQAANDPELSKINRYYVDGHTCSIGGAEMNCRLSWARANAVIDHLVKLGVPKEKLMARGYGLQYPAHSNDNEDTRRLNRRVVLKGDTRDSDSNKDPEPCSMSDKGTSGTSKKNPPQKSSPTIEEVAGIRGSNRGKDFEGKSTPDSSIDNNQKMLPRGFKKVD